VRRSGVSILASSPTMVGAITVLIVIVTVFLAYNANSGLPFVSTYTISATVPDAASLVEGNEVRIGGVRVGIVDTIEPVEQSDGSAAAQLNLQLDTVVDPLPSDSTFVIRSQSALGLKYLQIRQGDSPDGLAEGSVVPLSQARPEPVEIDQVLNTFQEPTRVAIQRNLLEFGNALAGRGVALNEGIGVLRPLVERLRPVMANLASPRTQLGRFFRALGATAAEVAPVAEAQAQFFVAADVTFAALADVARPFIQDTISETPPTLETANRALPQIRPFLKHSAALFADLQPGVEALASSAPAVADALEVGAPVLARSPKLNSQLPPTAQSLFDFSQNAGVVDGIERLTTASDELGPTLSFITPAQTVCNYATLFARNLASVVSTGNDLGTWQRFIPLAPPDGPNNEGGPSSGPAAGAGSDPGNFLHVNPYPNTAAPNQTFECEAGNEKYLAGQQVIGNVPGNQGTTTEDQP
jgi:phospholipid/cholesterol/gamma-HCH transport system substrate-binding protein